MTTFTGTNGDDTLPPAGSDNSGNDDFFGLSGNDTIHAGLGDDNVDAAAGDDLAYGEDGDDFLNGGADNDRLYGGNGVDSLDGGGGNDILNGGTGADTMVGNFGNDIYYVDNVGDVTTEFSAGDGLDTVKSSVTYTLAQFVDNMTLTGSANLGGTGNGDANKIIGNSGANQLSGLGGNDILDGRSGADHMLGGTGSDTYYVDNAGDVVDETGGDGIDKINSSISLSLVASAQVVGSVENLTLTGGANLNGTGNAFDNVIMGNTGNNTLNGGAANDRLSGVGGNDVLIGGTGADRLTGGLNVDTFTFQALGDSTVASTGRDLIMDFNHAQADKIDVSVIDANSIVAGNQAFAFISAAAFSGAAGELRSVVGAVNTTVSGDVNGDKVADFSILVKGVVTLQAGDFTL